MPHLVSLQWSDQPNWSHWLVNYYRFNSWNNQSKISICIYSIECNIFDWIDIIYQCVRSVNEIFAHNTRYSYPTKYTKPQVSYTRVKFIQCWEQCSYVFNYGVHWLLATPIAVWDLDAGVKLQTAAEELSEDTVVFRYSNMHTRTREEVWANIN